MNYKVGDIVLIKDINWYNKQKDAEGNIRTEHDWGFIKEQSKYCGKLAYITKVSYTYYNLNIDNEAYMWEDDMFQSDIIINLNKKDYSEISHILTQLGYKWISGNSPCNYTPPCEDITLYLHSETKLMSFFDGYVSSNIKPIDLIELFNMKEETKEIHITVPEGYEIDEDNSTFENIVFKKKADTHIGGFYISAHANILYCLKLKKSDDNKNLFKTRKQAESALAMAQISQLIHEYGGEITKPEWSDPTKVKYIIARCGNLFEPRSSLTSYYFLAFHTENQRDKFWKDHYNLIKDYYML